MSQIIISDTTTLITFEKLKKLSLLCQIFQRIIIPDSVYQEFLAGLKQDNSTKLAKCIHIAVVKSSPQLDNLLLLLDQGEAEAIELANRKQLPLIIDEKKGRKIAQQLGLTITGLAGVLILAVKKNVLSPDEAIKLLNSAIKSGHHLSESLYQQVAKTLLEQ